MPANDKSDWQIEKNKQKILTTHLGQCCSRSASGKVRILGHMYRIYLRISVMMVLEFRHCASEI